MCTISETNVATAIISALRRSIRKPISIGVPSLTSHVDRPVEHRRAVQEIPEHLNRERARDGHGEVVIVWAPCRSRSSARQSPATIAPGRRQHDDQ
jgi:hypothetical protein